MGEHIDEQSEVVLDGQLMQRLPGFKGSIRLPGCQVQKAELKSRHVIAGREINGMAHRIAGLGIALARSQKRTLQEIKPRVAGVLDQKRLDPAHAFALAVPDLREQLGYRAVGA